jgi:enamine deaminase RidA (YjgF/YER057c/UK114 family)
MARLAHAHLTPDGLFKPTVYSQVVVASGRRMVFISGQVAIDAGGNLVAPGDFAGQTRQAYGNLRMALAGAGASPSDVTKLTTFVVGYRPEMLPVIGEARTALFGSADPPASTLVGIQALARPEYLVEVEAIAVIA